MQLSPASNNIGKKGGERGRDRKEGLRKYYVAVDIGKRNCVVSIIDSLMVL
jgi:hypothetical protein